MMDTLPSTTTTTTTTSVDNDTFTIKTEVPITIIPTPKHDTSAAYAKSQDDFSSSVFDQIVTAIKLNNSNMLQQIVNKDQQGFRAAVNDYDSKGKTPLYIATQDKCYTELVLLLLEQGANVNKQVNLSDSENTTTTTTTSTSTSTTIVTPTTPFSLDGYSKPANRESVIHLVARSGDSDLLTLFIEHKADRDVLDSVNRTPIMLAAANGKTECARLLVLSTINLTLIDLYQKTALHLALDFGNEDIAGTITHNGGDLTVRYHYKPATQKGKQRIVTQTLSGDPSGLPEIAIIGQLDRYGHIRRDSQALKETQLLQSIQEQTDDLAADQEEPAELTREQIELELSRAAKWCRMMKNWVPGKKRPSKVDSRAIKGIPDRVRGQAWRLLSESDLMLQKNKTLYESLLEQSSQSELVIDLDVNRASRNHIYFRERYGQGQISLFNVLKAYSNYDQEIGYTQGMSSIATLLVMYLPENEAFWTMERIMNKPEYGMRDLFTSGLPKVHQMMYVYDRLLEQHVPLVYKHFESMSIASVIYATKWFIICFLDTLPFSICLRLWDLIFSKGYNIVYSVAITLIKMNERNLLDKPFEDCFQVFKSIEDMKLNEDTFIAMVMKNKFSSKKIEALEKSNN
ncbi:ankyrin repeat-containing protein [Cavenderia fasciculata]|uniref:Ankyrin repeat-containing protein n=1 Tax=Cavenderia fasciculata TaxID=261658 RepID=F4PSU0_CACFS|nr:ankyrin repeat-containing protein [Cavenderia fasciculata]EGG21568.1 ankyrin repeat-containing protein [Cavenderia fasciculata]|eukprot:XP_004359418.1 ankyrin repeat-containing protein [Cavenderia fasciculata]